MASGRKRPPPAVEDGAPPATPDQEILLEFSPVQKTPSELDPRAQAVPEVSAIPPPGALTAPPPTPAPEAPAEPRPLQDLGDLAADDLVMLDGTTAPDESAAPGVGAAGADGEGQDSIWHGPDGPEDQEPPLELDHSLPAAPAADGAPALAAEPLPEAGEVPPDHPASPIQDQDRRPRRSSGYTGQARARKKPLVLFSGWFRQRARLRIAAGFAVALGLGSVVPLIHASSVMSSQVRPLLQDLSTARAHKHQLQDQPNYRSPEQLEQAISSVRTRNMPVTFVLWAGLTVGLLFLWFRFA